MMQHQFSSPDGPIEVSLTRTDSGYALAGHSLEQTGDGRLKVHFSDGRVAYAHLAKVGDVWWVHLRGQTYRWERIEPGSSSSQHEGGLVAPMPGKVLEVLVKTGEEVQSGTPLMVLEAMKMEHRIVAAKDGVVTAVHFEAGDQVTQGAVLLELDE
jgi:3-methylcrotonyl-CoA carboxylase alpha subunit